MSSTSARRGAATRRIECPNHETAIYCDPAVVEIAFPLGKLPATGFRCPKCGEEILRGRTLEAAQQLARKLGLYGPQNVKERKALQIGRSVGVTLDRAHLEALGIHAGDVLEIGVAGDHLEVRVSKA
jgi:predicted RNA-binding Zn-ribbon protein involved in translation (DUF1610 family)